MTGNSLAEALRPIVSTMPRAVKEYEILRVAATLSNKTEKSIEIARDEVLRWTQKRSGGLLPKEAWRHEGFEYLSGGRNSVGVRLKSGVADLWTIRADDPDKQIPGRIWSTEVVVGSMLNQPLRFSARLLVSTTEDALDIEPHVPGLLQQITERVGLTSSGISLLPSPWIIREPHEAERLVELLVDPERKKPVFVLTVHENSINQELPLVDGCTLAKATLGIAHVVVLPSVFAWVLIGSLGRERSVFGGAVRTYLPGFSESANPYHHRLVLAEQLLSPDGTAQCLRWMRSLAAVESLRQTRLGNDVLSFASIRSAAFAHTQESLELSGASLSDQLLAAKAHIKALEDQIENEKKAQDFYAAAHDEAEARACAAEEQLRASVFRIQALSEQKKPLEAATKEDVQFPVLWGEIVDWCDKNFAGRLVLAPQARRNVKKPEFGDVALTARCLFWLATECRNRHLGDGAGSLREEIVEDGIRNAHCGSDQFDLVWQGQQYTADWHIKNGGNTRDPKRCLRIYYFWDPGSLQIIIADMPGHRVSPAT